tara:strand:+ start:6261 stop:7166 length:906 start_codon:yes stop_codon:yes gene_type:complete
MKVALCFLVNYTNSLIKEDIWKEWIEPNKDIIEVYIHYNKNVPIKSEWIKKHAIPLKNIKSTSYYHVIPAYFSVLQFALIDKVNNQWFCMLTESCVPIVSPQKFRNMFFNNSTRSIFSWRKAWWNVYLHKRSNLKYFQDDMRVGHDPWFVLKRNDVYRCVSYPKLNKRIFDLVCQGGLANESLFAIILYQNKKLSDVINQPSHVVDWSNPSSATSPYVFSSGSEKEVEFIKESLHKNRYSMFLRKIGKKFPDSVINQLIENNSSFKDDELEKYHEEWFLNYLYFLFFIMTFLIYIFNVFEI